MKVYAVEVEVEPGLWATYMANGIPFESTSRELAQVYASWLWQSAQCWTNVRVTEVSA